MKVYYCTALLKGRLKATILYPGQVYGIYTDGFRSLVKGDVDHGLTANNATHTGFNFKKFYSDLSEYDDYWDAARNFPVLRYAEVLLSYAEAKIEQGKVDASVYDAINQVRTRAGMPNVDEAKYNTADKLRELVRRERRVEFAYEGMRRWDIIRWGIAKDVLNQPLLRAFSSLAYQRESQSLMTPTRRPWGLTFCPINCSPLSYAFSATAMVT